jgi:hypothetical protein
MLIVETPDTGAPVKGSFTNNEPDNGQKVADRHMKLGAFPSPVPSISVLYPELMYTWKLMPCVGGPPFSTYSVKFGLNCKSK